MTVRKQGSSLARLNKRILPFFVLAGLPMFFLFGGYDFLSFSQLTKNYARLNAFVDEQLATASLIFGATYVVTVALSLPIASLLTVVGGALLGWTGAAVIICAATIGATIVFIAAQTVMNEFFAKRTSGLWQNWKPGFRRMPFLPFGPAPDARSPFLDCKYCPCSVRDAPEPLCAGNIIGITPGTVIYVWVARSFDILLSRGQSPDFSVLSEPAIIVPLFALGLLSLAPTLWKRLRAHQRISH